MKRKFRTAFHFVGGCFLLFSSGCDFFSPPRIPPIPQPQQVTTIADTTESCVIRLHGSVLDVSFNDTTIQCTDMPDLDSALNYFGKAKAVDRVLITWEGDVTYGAVIDVIDELKKDSITNYTLQKAGN